MKEHKILKYLDGRSNIVANLRGNVLAIIVLVLSADLLGLDAAVFNATIVTTVEATKSSTIITIEIQDTRRPTVRGTLILALLRGLEMNYGAGLLDGRVKHGCTHLGADRIAYRLVDGVAHVFFDCGWYNFINDLAFVAALLLSDSGANRVLLNQTAHLCGYVLEPEIQYIVYNNWVKHNKTLK